MIISKYQKRIKNETYYINGNQKYIISTDYVV